MAIEESQIKFAVSKDTGETIGFVSRHSKTKKLWGVREDSPYPKKICVLSSELKSKEVIIPNQLYNVKLKPMHSQKGYVVVEAFPVKFKARIEKEIVAKSVYRITIIFGNKIIYFDPIKGNSQSSKTIEGVLRELNSRKDIDNLNSVVEEFKYQAQMLVNEMQKDGIL